MCPVPRVQESKRKSVAAIQSLCSEECGRIYIIIIIIRYIYM
jgi:hypothetical protein